LRIEQKRPLAVMRLYARKNWAACRDENFTLAMPQARTAGRDPPANFSADSAHHGAKRADRRSIGRFNSG
jgi:hypothetical protein